MARLTLQLLGPITATGDNGIRVGFAYDKVRALFAYLVAEPGRVHPRGRVATLLWPEKPETAARHSLSQALTSLRSSIQMDAAEPSVIRADRQSLRFTPEPWFAVDLLDFRALLERSQDPAVPVDALRRAVSLYRGPFLDGLSLPDCPEFEDWQRAMQENISRAYGSALRTLATKLEGAGNFAEASGFADRLIELDPWDEASHRLKMQILTTGGNRTGAIRHYEACVELLRRDLDLTPEPETEALATRIRAGVERVQLPAPHRASPPPAMRRHTTNVVSPIIGREPELEEISGALESADGRLITLVGPGGIGKSRLALEVVHSSESQFPDGAYFVPLAGVSTPALLPRVLLDAIEAQVDPKGDHTAHLCSALEQRELLLVLDNFEHLLDGALVLNQLLNAAPKLRLLVTSRQRLALTSESVIEITGLSLPDAADVPALARSGSTRLFMFRARKHKSSFLPREQDAPAIARIAHLTGGMPLAIELAAAWIPVLTPDEIADEIEQNLDFLSTEFHDVPERHRSIRAVLDRSWEHLSEVEQRIFRRLAVFSGGFSRNAASYVTGASLPVLSALVGKSLVRLNEQSRYEIHELLRQYAAARLAELPREEDLVRDRFRDYFTGFVAVREEQLKSGAQAHVIAEISAEMDNIRAAWWRSTETEDIKGMLRTVHSLWLYFDITDRYVEGKSLLRAGWQALKALGQIPAASKYEHSLALARMLSREAALDFRLNGPSTFQQQVDQAMALLHELDEPAEEGLLLNYLACAAHASGEYETEERYLLDSLRLFEEAGDEWGLAYSRNDLGQLRALHGRYEDARDLHLKALTVLERCGDQRGIAFALRNLGIAESHLGNPDRAIEFLRRSVEVRRPIGNQWGMAESLKQIGIILRESGLAGDAERHFRQALHLARDIRAMQLASEIISEYLPMLPSSELSSVRELSLEPVPFAPVKQDENLNISAVSRLADVLLDRSAGAEIATEMRSGCVP